MGTPSDDSDHTETGAKAMPIELKLSYRLKLSYQSIKSNGNNTDKHHRAPDHLVLTWEEFFMGLAELQRIFCNSRDTKATAKVFAYCS